MSKSNLRNLDLNLLVVFDAVASERNLTRAGQLLGLTQPAVSHAMNRLRRLAGDPLYRREAGVLVFTERGEHLAEEVREALEVLHRAIGDTAETFNEQTSRRRFVIDLPLGLDNVLAPRLAHCIAHCINVSLRVFDGRADVALKDLRRDASSLAVDYEPMIPTGFKKERISFEPLVSIVRKGHAKAHRALSIAAFERMSHVGLMPSRDILNGLGGGLFQPHGLKLNCKVAVPTPSALAAVVEQTDLAAVLPVRLAKELARRHQILVCALPDSIARVELSMIWHEKVDADEGHRWLRAAVRESAEGM